MTSNIGKLAIKVPGGVSITVDKDNQVVVVGPKGTLSKKMPREVEIVVDGETASVKVKNDSIRSRAMHGTSRSNLNNMVTGVTNGWKKTLELVGSGYRAEVKGTDLVLAIGFSHPVVIPAPVGITFKVEKSLIHIDGIDKELVGWIADKIRAVRPPEPYKGKGIRYQNEVVRRKAGKAAKTVGGA